MPNPVAARRLEVLAAAQAGGEGFLRFEPGRLRCSLGTSLADLAVPVEVAPEARSHPARGRARGGAAAHPPPPAAGAGRAARPAAAARGLQPGSPPWRRPFGGAGGGPDLRAAAALAAASHPSLTPGLAAAWLGRGGKGRSLVGLWIELLRRAFEEQASARGEETSVIVALALAAETAAAEQVVREALPVTHADRWLRAGAMMALWTAAQTGLQRAFRDAGLAAGDPARARLEAALSPTVLLGGRVGLQAAGATVYGCELSAGVPRADELVARLSTGLGRRGAAARAVRAARRRRRAGGAGRAGGGGGQAARAAHPGGAAGRGPRAGRPGDGAARAAGDAGRRWRPAPPTPRRGRRWRRQLAAAAPGGEAGALVERAVRALQGWRPREPGAVFGLAREAARAEYALAAAALCADLALERLAARRHPGAGLPHRAGGRGRRRGRVRGRAALPAQRRAPGRSSRPPPASRWRTSSPT